MNKSLLATLLTFCMLANPVDLSAQSDEKDQQQIENALKYRPRQKGVAFDTPTEENVAQCRIASAADTMGASGWIIFDHTGRTVRAFLDRNKDSKFDQWSYFQNGIEVYREQDENFDQKVDQYRWMGTAGIRWGVDDNQDGEIDTWKVISAQEVAEEAFEAIKSGDRNRFERLLLTRDELAELQLGSKMERVIGESVDGALEGFVELARSQKSIKSESRFSNFGGERPSLVPAGKEGIENDLVVYDHAQALFSTGNKFTPIALGTVVRAGDRWRIVETPEILTGSTLVSNGGIFYPMPAIGDVAGTNQDPKSEVDDEVAELFRQYEDLEKKLEGAKAGTVTARLQEQRADLLVQLIEQHGNEEDQVNWTRQLADTVSSAFQEGLFPGGLEFLEGYAKKATDRPGTDYVAFRVIQARSHAGLQGNSREQEEANIRYMEDLEDYVRDYPNGNFAADALLQLALYAEVSSDRDAEEQAIRWYQRIVDGFEGSPESDKAAGAIVRLRAVGNQIQFRGPTLTGEQTFDLRAYRDKRIVVLQFWATWCDTCVDDFDELKRLKAKYPKELSIIGVNLDEDSEEVTSFLRGKGVTWPQLWDEGGLEASSFASQLGVTTLPLTILVDKNGEVIDNQASVPDLDRDIQSAIRRAKTESARANSDTQER